MNEENRRRFDWPRFARRALAVVAGAVFVYAGSVKLVDPLRFASDISNYQILSWPIAVRFAFYLPWLEVICGLAIIFHRLVAGSIAIAIALMFVFIGATIWARAHGIDVSCGCFGTASSNLTLTWHLVLNSCILAALLFLWITRERTPVVAKS